MSLKGSRNVAHNDKEKIAAAKLEEKKNREQVKFEIHGEEMIEKKVKASGNSGRVYLPPDWIGHNVKIVRID